MGGGGRGKRKEDQEGWWWVSGMVVERGLLLNGWESDRKASNLEPNWSFIWAALLVCLPGGGSLQQSTGTEKEADDPSGRQGHPLEVGIYLAATVLCLGSRVLPPASCFHLKGPRQALVTYVLQKSQFIYFQK